MKQLWTSICSISVPSAALLGLICLATPVLAQSQPSNAPANATSTPVVESVLNIWEKRLMQEGLIILGYYNGFADGSFGQGTRDALSAFQTKQGRAATGQVTAADALRLAGAAFGVRKKVDWRPLDSTTGIRMFYPAAILTRRAGNQSGGETLNSGDDHISLMTFHIPGADSNGIDALFDKQMNGQNQVTYKFRRQNAFILSGTRQGGKFYTRVEQKGDDIRGYDLIWKAEDDVLMQRISVLISNGFDPFGRNAADGQPTYPVLQKLADLVDQDTSQQDKGNSNKQAQGAQSANSSPNQDEAVVERKDGALPAPTDGTLVTSDGKGLRFTYEYRPPDDSALRYAYQWAVNTHLFSNIPEVDGLDGMLMIPRPLRYVTAQCGTINAFYAKKISSVVLCYEMIDSLTKLGAALAKGASDPNALTVEFVRDNIRFILLHESGHAMIDMLDLPAVGREEDSVDQLAAVLLLAHVNNDESTNDIARVLQLAATWFKVNSAGAKNDNVAVFADEHSLDAQRYFNLLCIVYGRDPDHFRGIVDGGMLPKERANRCPDESAKITRSWARLLLPHFSPRFRPRDDAAPDDNRKSAPPPAQTGNPLEWDGKSNPFKN
ncbi:DUF4344 domain-containing metallopeptidase [Bradyrhizobium genosp. L]|uniref:DUF4344 domain-containing metallopeptidase n=1 Tax=Bradyrhizobium genosp. L TaxID=83637 RepID=UPI001FEF25B6|nr:DUF4344 domain-containing metallopeptidase [Bradyrhizobium genosp. L]